MDSGAERKTVRVTIFNQTYTLAATDEAGEVETLAHTVDELMTSIAQRAGNMDAQRIAVLACLHLADRLRRDRARTVLPQRARGSKDAPPLAAAGSGHRLDSRAVFFAARRIDVARSRIRHARRRRPAGKHGEPEADSLRAVCWLAEQTGCAGEGDALVTAHAGVAVSVRTADCYPILLADDRNRAVAAVHAGWRGTAARIVVRALEEMHRALRHGSSATCMRPLVPALARAATKWARK